MELIKKNLLVFVQINQSSNNRIMLDERTGIDILGNIMESSVLSRNRDLYGDLHNMGHVFLSYAHDPDHRHLESFGVMGDSTTAMRDPIFYRWHAFIDDLFQEHKQRLPAVRLLSILFRMTVEIIMHNFQTLNISFLVYNSTT